MANYLTPGVYVEENLAPPGLGDGSASRAVAAFVGIAPKGPTLPTRVRSWAQYVNLFGGFTGPTSWLPYAVYLYFANGGTSCFIARATRADAVAATATLMDSTKAQDQGPKPAFKVTALAEGVWGNATSIKIVPTGAPSGRFDLIVLDDGRESERFTDLSSDPGDSRYVISIVNSPYSGSIYLRLANQKVNTEGYQYNPATDVVPAQTLVLNGGSEGVQAYDLAEAAKSLQDVPAINFDLNLPGVSQVAVLNPIIDWAASTGRVFVVIDGPRAAEGSTSAQVMAGYLSMVNAATPLVASSYAAIYGPWIMTSDPSSTLYGAVRLLPPGGAMLGQMAKTDVERHVAKAPAGIPTTLAAVVAAEARFTEGELDTLADAHINVVRLIPGYGHCIMGARTLKRELPDRYVPVRRTLIMLRKTLADTSRFAVFEPNGPDLWERVRLVLTKYLSGLLKAGVLAGQSESEAFFVRCDQDNNPQSQINAGRLNIDIGVALRYPAEFVIIRLGQHHGGTDSAEDNL
ncbi:phage tail sheath C-terminal domain-containing protein [Nonomuraea typhae]|uniref:phage tail sheath C-terminal domain-containing protein n=1 Tax=Nonomuraea typhae TaxID=2603600 RepID=UPI0012F93E9F|nr:phage tail sheath C-terminal domain-containing protein [Nonomuraea typhae]